MDKKEESFWTKVLIWRNETIPQKYFVLILAVIVGLSSGFAAAVLKSLVHGLRHLLTSNFASDYFNVLYFVYPTIGILLSIWITKRFLLDKHPGHGVPNVLYAISKRNGIIPRIGMINSMITAIVTVGFGGSAGLEGPTVGTSSAIASNIGRGFKVNYKTKTLMIGCAASAAMAAMFNAPIAAIVFAIEVIMLDLTTGSMIPLLLASVSAALMSHFFFENTVLFHVDHVDPFDYADIGFYVLLGIIAGLISLYFSSVYFSASKIAEKVKNKYKKGIIGGVLLGLLMFIFPALFGEGYTTINAMISGEYDVALINSPLYAYKENMVVVLIVLAALIFLKSIAMSITVTSGGVGGIFAPTLFMGSIIGFSYAKIFNYYDIAELSSINYTLVGMAALMAGNIYAPLTAIFLIAEITGGYSLFIPLMIATSLSYLTVRIFSTHSIYTVQLAKKGELITHDKDQAVLTLMNLHSEIETNFDTVTPEMNLGELVKVVSRSKRNLYPVLNDNAELVGLVALDDIREIMFKSELYDTVFVPDVMIAPMGRISTEDNMDKVMTLFEETGAWNLPVLENGKYVGFVSKSKLFSAYRKLLQDFYHDYS